MFRWLRVVFTGLTVTFSLPLFVVAFLIACAAVAVIALAPRLVAHRGPGGRHFQRQWARNQFRFKDSVRSYEDLIDAQARRLQ